MRSFSPTTLVQTKIDKNLLCKTFCHFKTYPYIILWKIKPTPKYQIFPRWSKTPNFGTWNMDAHPHPPYIKLNSVLMASPRYSPNHHYSTVPFVQKLNKLNVMVAHPIWKKLASLVKHFIVISHLSVDRPTYKKFSIMEPNQSKTSNKVVKIHWFSNNNWCCIQICMGTSYQKQRPTNQVHWQISSTTWT